MKWLLIRIALAIICIITLVGLGLLIRLSNVKVPQMSVELVGIVIAALATVIAALVMAWLPARMEKNKAAKELEQELKEQDDEVMRSVKAIKGHAQVYRKSIHADPRIATMQILDMSRPLDVTGIYVRLRVNDEPNLRFKLNQNSVKAEQHRDPNALLKTEKELLEYLFSKALDPVEAITQYKRSIIVGDPGAGKSTLLKYLTLKSTEGSLNGLPDLPVHIELNAFATSGYSDLLEFAASVWESRYGFPRAEAANYIKDNLASGQAMLLLDALDETVIGKTTQEAEKSYEYIVNCIINLATRYPLSPIAVTVRKASYYQKVRLTGFKELEVLDFRQKDIEQFVIQWFSFHSTRGKLANANDLNTRLKRNPRLLSLAANPLLLSLIVIVYEAELDLPDRRTELYKQCVDILLTKWDASRNLRRRREFKTEHKRQLLQEVAWYFHRQGRRYIPKDELLSVIALFLPAINLQASQNQRILEEIVTENGLLKEQAREWYGFLHLTLQEYFVAQYVSDHNLMGEILKNRHDSWWKEVVVLLAGLMPDASPLLQELLNGHRKLGFTFSIWLNTDIILAGNCLATRPTVRQTSVRSEIIHHLFEILVKNGNTSCNQYLAPLLVEIGGKEVYTSILGLISSHQVDQNIRQWLAYALGRFGEDSIASDLLHLLLDTRIDMVIRQGIAYAIGETGDQSVKPGLIQMFCNPQIDQDLCRSIYYTLYKLEGDSLNSNIRSVISNSQTSDTVRKHLNEILLDLSSKHVM